ncbi:MAG: hypothetical protein HC933_05775 [Pleurocapsa sp. SU_196_0]|nr:hypothetical protein [Pleurocapsa sp. SU_196_0]
MSASRFEGWFPRVGLGLLVFSFLEPRALRLGSGVEGNKGAVTRALRLGNAAVSRREKNLS